MKIETSSLQAGEKFMVSIYVDQPSDYQILYKLIEKGDFIETKIRRKDKSLKVAISFPIVELLVQNIEYVSDPDETIHISGVISTSYNQNLKEGTKQSLWITDGCELKLIKNNWKETDLQIIDEVLHPEKKVNKNVCIASDRNLQVKCFEILRKYMAKKFNLVLYGNEIFDALENGAIKVLFVTEDFINRQNDQWKSILSSKDHKYRGGNIVVYDQGSSNWEELTGFGGMVGVLKYDYAPSRIIDFD